MLSRFVSIWKNRDEMEDRESHTESVSLGTSGQALALSTTHLMVRYYNEHKRLHKQGKLWQLHYPVILVSDIATYQVINREAFFSRLHNPIIKQHTQSNTTPC